MMTVAAPSGGAKWAGTTLGSRDPAPAEAGGGNDDTKTLGSRLRGNDDTKTLGSRLRGNDGGNR